MFADTSIDIKSVFPINDAMMQVNYETKESYIPDSSKQFPSLMHRCVQNLEFTSTKPFKLSDPEGLILLTSTLTG